MNPNMTNLTSPNEAMITPTTMAETLASFFMSGGEIAKAQVARRVTTALSACHKSVIISRHIARQRLSPSTSE
jgi:hypothetical protein